MSRLTLILFTENCEKPFSCKLSLKVYTYHQMYKYCHKCTFIVLVLMN